MDKEQRILVDNNLLQLNESSVTDSGSLILISLTCFNNESKIINTSWKECSSSFPNYDKSQASITTSNKSDQQVDAVLYVVVVLVIYTSAMVALLIKYMKHEETRRGYFVSYYKDYTDVENRLSNVEDPQTENKERLKATKTVLQGLYGNRWVYLCNPWSSQDELNCKSAGKNNGQKQVNDEECPASLNSSSEFVNGDVSNRNYCDNNENNSYNHHQHENQHRRMSTPPSCPQFVYPTVSIATTTPCGETHFSTCVIKNGISLESLHSCDYSNNTTENSSNGIDRRGDNFFEGGNKAGCFDMIEAIPVLSRSDSGFLSQSESLHSIQSIQEICEDS